ncbi:restriction endonuclease subunit S [Bizionia sp.]|uniref:restriction endonuclease subunit S n=1 Tax=Bizionia sp. TaxID=1954480 RepID=UPI003A95CD5E
MKTTPNIKNQEIKKIEPNQGSDSMREDWIECTVGDLLKLKNGFAFKSSNYKSEGIPVLRIGDIQDWNVDAENAKRIEENKEYDSHIVKKGDVLIAMSGATTGKFGIYNSNEKAYQNQRVGNLIPHSEKFILKNYVYYLLYSLKRDIEQQAYGGAQPNISATKIEALNTKLFPLPTQKAIVKKIEELFSSLDSGIADLKKAQDQLVIYRQAVLKKAFEGELTKEWREKQTNLPSADELLEQIETGRQIFYDNQIEEWEIELKKWKEKGEIGKKPKKPRPLTIPDAPNNGHYERKWDIPNNWVWSQIGSLCFVTKLAGFEYTDFVNYDEDGDLPVLKAENAGPNGFKKTDFSKVKSESVKILTRSQIFGGELLIVFVGAGTGNVAMVPFNQRYFLGPNIGMARPYFDLNSKYLELFLQSAFGKSLMMSAVKAVAQPSLSMGTIRQAPIAFPSLKEQHQIVSDIESRLSVCDKVEKDIADSLEKAQALRQSILKKAFEGTLLSAAEIKECKEHKEYEPASVLLERIREEKKKK